MNQFLVLLFAIFVCSFAEDSKCTGPISVAEYNSLYDLYNQTDGTSWNWLVAMPEVTMWHFPSDLSAPCRDRWQGLNCTFSPQSSTDCVVSTIRLPYYNLQGPLPSTLSNLGSLVTLALAYNSLTGNIPCELGLLSSLQYLYVSDNTLSGTIPEELGTLQFLKQIYFYDNMLHGSIPSSLGALPQLSILTLSRNLLSGTIPCELGNLISLEDISLGFNCLSGSIPSEFGMIYTLQAFEVHANALSGRIPPDFGNISSLIQLYLYENRFTGTIPAQLSQISVLESLEFYTNCLTGTLPSQLGLLHKLQTLEGYSNQFTGTIPSEYCNLVSGIDFSWGINLLTGTIPSCLAKIESLQGLVLYSNKLTGSIPSDLGNLAQLRVLNMYLNYLSGVIPSELAKSSIGGLFIFQNLLSGTIPGELGNSSFLTAFVAYENHLSGSIPSELGNSRSLDYINLYSNNLVGSIPSELANIVPLNGLFLYSNRLTGTIPSEFGSLLRFLELDLNSNSLTGTIPSEFFDSVGLATLSLSFNSLTGTLPAPALSNKFQFIFAESNMLTGSLPTSFNRMTLLQVLLLSSNYLDGETSVLPSLPLLTSAVFSNNHFSGSLPQFQDSFHVENVDYSSNLLSGSLGSSLNNCTNLRSLAVGNNLLTGPLPSGLVELTRLRSLNVSSNFLTGDLTPFVGLTGRLESLDISLNHLTGTLPESVFLISNLTSVFFYGNCFAGTLPAALCSSDSVQNVFFNSLSTNCKSKLPSDLQKVFPGSSNQQLVRGSIPSCVWGLSKLQLLLLSGNRFTGSIEANVPASTQLKVLILSSNHLNGPIPDWIQVQSSMQQLDLSQNRLSGTLASNLLLSTEITLFSVSVNRLSGRLPNSLFGTYSALDMDVLNGNLFSCAQSSSLSSWGSGLTNPSLPSMDPNKDTYVCGSSGFDESLVFAVVLMSLGALVAACVAFVWLKRSRIRERWDCLRNWLKTALEADRYLTLMIRSRMWSLWSIVGPILAMLLMLFVILKKSPTLSAFTTHTDQYFWVTTAAFLRGWAPAFIVLMAMLVSFYGIIRLPIEQEDATIDSNIDQKTLQPSTASLYVGSRVLLFLRLTCMHLLSIVAVVATNAAYVYATVQGLPRNELFAVQLFLGCFKLAWNDCVIPAMLRLFIARENKVPHRAFMALFAFVGGPFVSTFFSASTCFLYAITRQPSITTTVEVPQYQCSVSCAAMCDDCYTKCAPSCGFESTQISISSTPQWVYSYQCSSTLLLEYVPVMIAMMVVSLVVMPFLLIFLSLYSLRNPNVVWSQRFLNVAVMRPATIENSEGCHSFLDGQRIRIKMLINVTVLSTFGLASPVLGVIVLLDSVSWCLVWHLLVGRQLEVLTSTTTQSLALRDTFTDSAMTKDNMTGVFATFGAMSLEAMKEANQRPVDHLVVFAFVGVFWSLFVFDMIGDVYGDLSGGLSMLVPLLSGLLVWLGTYCLRPWLLKASRNFEGGSPSPIGVQLSTVNPVHSNKDTWSVWRK